MDKEFEEILRAVDRLSPQELLVQKEKGGLFFGKGNLAAQLVLARIDARLGDRTKLDELKWLVADNLAIYRASRLVATRLLSDYTPEFINSELHNTGAGGIVDCRGFSVLIWSERQSSGIEIYGAVIYQTGTLHSRVCTITAGPVVTNDVQSYDVAVTIVVGSVISELRAMPKPVGDSILQARALDIYSEVIRTAKRGHP